MNFKPNAWTLLFAIALGAFLYQMNMKPKAEEPTTTTTTTNEEGKDNNKCEILEMPTGEFYKDYGQFLTYSSFIKTLFEDGAKACPTLKDEFEKYADLTNPEVWMFHIPRCELNTMLELHPDGDYYAYLIMKETPDSKMIDLAFGHNYIPGNPQLADMDKTLAAKGDGDGGEFFDFTRPCPPTCPPD